MDTSPLRLLHHYIYIVVCLLLASVIFYLPGSVSYTDSLLLASGAATQTGLNPIDLHRLHVVQQGVLWVVPMVTNVVFMHSLLVLIRLYWFRRRFRHAIRDAKALCRTQRQRLNQHLRDLVSQGAVQISRPTIPVARESEEQPLLENDAESSRKYQATTPHITFDDEHDPDSKPRHRSFSSAVSRRRSQSESGDVLHDANGSLPPLMWQASIASYSDWDEAQKEELGGIEYRALKTLLIILVGYFLAFHLLGIVLFVAWTMLSRRDDPVFSHLHVAPAWWAVFTAGSAFNDLGYTLTPDSLISFRTAAFPQLVMTFLIVVGNTGFPCMLRLIIWLLSKMSSYGSQLDEELQYLLNHPRRCFTLLFPSAETWRLAAVLLLLNAIDLIIFYSLQEIPSAPGIRFVNALFQIASTRTAGFSITALGQLHPAVQVSFMVMMYISAFPIAIAIRKTNVYEEKSLGIYHADEDTTTEGGEEENTAKPHANRGLTAHIQRQLGFDLWYVMLGFFLVAVAEGSRLQQHRDDLAFSLFPILFEIVSAYGTVGLSLGYPRTETSLCGEFSIISKLVVVAMQVRAGRMAVETVVEATGVESE
ncbi:low affinity potassium transporter [Aspergillus tanneri]|uniref:Low affinity potassium transporter n=1 Tax=Aspergillus tanneri TaxID=1220188 RepID=A0A5M9MYP4_9EURO|nr:low affinity potassium transporter [Aspergillus tanneri]KAA8650474.1 low affinity potassium transporter [Aspergillus tanneri]